MRLPALLITMSVSLAAQTLPAPAASFDAASIRPVLKPAGRDFRGRITTTPTSIRAHNVSLENLIGYAWRVEAWQLSGGPHWLDSDEFDLAAETGKPVTAETMAAMLRKLLITRFHLELQRESAEMRVYALVTAKGGAPLRPAPADATGDIPAAGRGVFRSDMAHLARFLAVQLSIPPPADPTRPAIADEKPVPVIDATGLSGLFEFDIELAPEPGQDAFSVWQRVLKPLGLQLEPRRMEVERLVIASVNRQPDANE